ncbi:hypothetical protein PGC34_07100 [Pseudomonas kribbensis]|uniref:hypothetical protein n=1 Tax=Pseudomonas kribbensis TaxID=1628086 RepID=UPI00273A445B|nr:hypothetical protein [Pseudomonas sp. A29(2023)]MDL5595677.1 hypothetical protein [Bacillus subtilis]
MKYSIDYQQLHKGQHRPTDDGVIVGVSFDSESGFALIPNVGDVVDVPEMGGHCGVYGVVKSRLFTYTRLGDELFCGINIVVEEADIDHGTLIKE